MLRALKPQTKFAKEDSLKRRRDSVGLVQGNVLSPETDAENDIQGQVRPAKRARQQGYVN